MTTETTAASRTARPQGAAMLRVAVAAGVAVGAVVALLGGLLGGSTGLLGAAAGAGVTLLVLAGGFAVVDLVSSLRPAASMVFALATYTLQIVLLAVVLGVLRSIDDVDSTLEPAWFAGGVIAVALAWTVCLVWHAMHARVPLYDLPDSVTAGSPEGSER